MDDRLERIAAFLNEHFRNVSYKGFKEDEYYEFSMSTSSGAFQAGKGGKAAGIKDAILAQCAG